MESGVIAATEEDMKIKLCDMMEIVLDRLKQ